MRLCNALVLLPLSLGACAIDTAPGDDDVGSVARALVYVPGQWPSLQAAIDAAPDGATIELGAGTLYEPITVAGKRLTLVGAGKNATALDGANVPGPLVTLGSGGKLRLQDLSLTSPTQAITSVAPNGDPGALRLVNVAAHGDSMAAGGRFASFRAKGVEFTGPVALTDTATLVFDKVTANAPDPAGGPAVRIDNRGLSSTPCIVSLNRVTALAGAAGGIAILGGACPVYASHIGVAGARVFGIGFFQTNFARVFDAHVVNTFADTAGNLGDGVYVWASNVQLVDSKIENSARAGVSVFGCDADGTTASADLSGVDLRCNAFDMNYENVSLLAPSASCSGSSAKVTDGGLNACRACDGAPIACKAVTANLKPISL